MRPHIEHSLSSGLIEIVIFLPGNVYTPGDSLLMCGYGSTGKSKSDAEGDAGGVTVILGIVKDKS